MVHFFGIFSPPANRQAGEDQQAFFSDTPTKAEAEAAVLTGKRPPQAEEDLEDADFVATRFVTLLSPPYI